MAYIGQKPGSNFRDVSIKDSFTGDGSTTAFDLAKSFSQADVNGIEVFVDKEIQKSRIPENRTSGIPDFRNPGFPEFWNSDFPKSGSSDFRKSVIPEIRSHNISEHKLENPNLILELVVVITFSPEY